MKQNSLKNIFVKIFQLGIIGPINLLLIKFKKILYPRWLVFEVTDNCNSRCTHCNIWNQKSVKNPLTLEEIERTIKSPVFAKLKHVILTGGEPILRTDLKEIIFAIHKILPKVEFTLSTNGLLPDQVLKLVKEVVENKITIIVGVSLDAVGEKNDLIRGVKGNFERSDFLLKELIKLKNIYGDKVRPAVGFTLSELTLDSVKDIIEYNARLKTDFVVAMYEQASYYHNLGKKMVTNKEVIKFLKLIPATLHREILIKTLKNKSFNFSCFALNTFCVLRCNGDIVPCLKLAHLSIGNVRKDNPLFIWKSKEAQKIRGVVKGCHDCLNTWAVEWSLRSAGWPILKYAGKTRLKKIYGKKY